MFSPITPIIRQSVFGIAGLTQIAPHQISASNGTGFMIAPGVIATAAHVLNQATHAS